MVKQNDATTHFCKWNYSIIEQRFKIFLNWPPRSREMTPLDYFFFNYVESHIYNYNPQSFLKKENGHLRSQI